MRNLLEVIERIIFRCEGVSTDYKTLVDIGFATLEFDTSKSTLLSKFDIEHILTIEGMVAVLEHNDIYLTAINSLELTDTADRIYMLEVLKKSYLEYDGFKIFSTYSFINKDISDMEMSKAYHTLMERTESSAEIIALDYEWEIIQKLKSSSSILKRELGIE